MTGEATFLVYGDSRDERKIVKIPSSGYCFYKLFEDSKNILSVSVNPLPFKTLTRYCYSNMFYGCVRLTFLPESLLSATNLIDSCCSHMFYGCTGLVSLPNGLLPATTLASSCYSYMFYYRSGLKLSNSEQAGWHIVLNAH